MVGVGLCYNHLQNLNLLCSLLLRKSHQASLYSESFTRSFNFLFFMSGIWTNFRLSVETLIFNKQRQSSSIFVMISFIYHFRETYWIGFLVPVGSLLLIPWKYPRNSVQSDISIRFHIILSLICVIWSRFFHVFYLNLM